MIFFDCLYGPIKIDSPLFRDLIDTPEFWRLRRVRMLNIDTPLSKDMATASRFAHTVGVCHLSERLAQSRRLSKRDGDVIMAAAVLHDMGIPPFGHLFEEMFAEIDPPFDHEKVAREIVEGTYAPENRYHQILDGKTLQIAAILDKHDVDRDAVFRLLEPRRSATVISGPMDLDNIDNVLRMATLLGLGNYRRLAYALASCLRTNIGGQAALIADAVPLVNEWLRVRARSYEIMMYAKEGIAYAALLYDLAETAVRRGVVRKDEWFLTDDKVLARLLDNDATSALAEQLEGGVRYDVMAVVRLVLDAGEGPILRGTKRRQFIGDLSTQAEISGDRFSIFVWYEYARVSRTVNIGLDEKHETVGQPSSSAVVALIDRHTNSESRSELRRDVIKAWPRFVHETATRFARTARVTSLPDTRHFLADGIDDDDSQLSIFDTV